MARWISGNLRNTQVQFIQVKVKNSLNRYWVAWMSVGALTLLLSIALAKMSSGKELLLAYPFISDDGFDWIYQGFSFSSRINTVNVPILPVLRDPGFVLVNAIDYFLNLNGSFVILIQSLSFFIVQAVILDVLETFAFSLRIVLSFLSISVFSILNFFRLFILADSMAVAFLCLSTWALIHFFLNQKRKFYFWGIFFGVVGALTQTYACIPLLIGLSLILIFDIHENKDWLRSSISLVISVLTIFSLKTIWSSAIEHESTPQSFSLIKLNLQMLGFYLNLWCISFIPLAPFLLPLVIKKNQIEYKFLKPFLFLATTTICFMILTFFYQWKEARFTFIYFPVVILTLIFTILFFKGTMLHFSKTFCFFVLSISFVSGMVITPKDMWQPQMNGLSLDPQNSWLAQAFYTDPNQRLTLTKRIVTVPTGYGTYPSNIINCYINLKQSIEGGFLTSKNSQLKKLDEFQLVKDSSVYGFIEKITKDNEKIYISGWAADVNQKKPVLSIRCFYKNNPIAVEPINLQRPDVNNALRLKKNVKAGFELVIDNRNGSPDIFVEVQDGTLRNLNLINQDGK
jgi:hypothetical protein